MATEKFDGWPVCVRAIGVWDNRKPSYFLNLFGRPARTSVCECERSGDSSLAQSLHLYNSVEMAKKVAGERLKKLVADKRSAEDRLRELYLVALSRPPSQEEMARMTAYLQARSDNLSSAYEDLLWAVLNTKEFLYNH